MRSTDEGGRAPPTATSASCLKTMRFHLRVLVESGKGCDLRQGASGKAIAATTMPTLLHYLPLHRQRSVSCGYFTGLLRRLRKETQAILFNTV